MAKAPWERCTLLFYFIRLTKLSEDMNHFLYNIAGDIIQGGFCYGR